MELGHPGPVPHELGSGASRDRTKCSWDTAGTVPGELGRAGTTVRSGIGTVTRELGPSHVSWDMLEVVTVPSG